MDDFRKKILKTDFGGKFLQGNTRPGEKNSYTEKRIFHGLKQLKNLTPFYFGKMKHYSYPNQITNHPYPLQRSNGRPLNYPTLNNFADFTTGQQGLIITPLYLKRKLVPTTHGLKLSTTKEEQGFLLKECFRWNQPVLVEKLGINRFSNLSFNKRKP